MTTSHRLTHPYSLHHMTLVRSTTPTRRTLQWWHSTLRQIQYSSIRGKSHRNIKVIINNYLWIRKMFAGRPGWRWSTTFLRWEVSWDYASASASSRPSSLSTGSPSDSGRTSNYVSSMHRNQKNKDGNQKHEQQTSKALHGYHIKYLRAFIWHNSYSIVQRHQFTVKYYLSWLAATNYMKQILYHYSQSNCTIALHMIVNEI